MTGCIGKKYIVSFLFFFFCTFVFIGPVLGDNAEIEKKIEEYKQKLVEIRQQKNTLSSQIQEMDTQIYITGLTIQRSEQKIIDTQNEIEKLGSRIENLDSSLGSLSKMLLQRIVDGYKTQQVSLFELLLDTKTMADLTNKIKYQKTTQNNNQKLLIQVQEAKVSYEEQKALREQKKVELDQLVISLNAQKEALKIQQAQKEKLLADTNNDETTYQSLLAQAQAQLKGFKSFVSSSGVDSIIEANAFGSGSDGAYYSQRDARWAKQTIGGSPETILNVGCLLTSISMYAKKNGQDITPANIAIDGSRFFGNTAYMVNPWPGVAGKSYHDMYGSRDNIRQELDTGNYVIVGVSYSGGCYYGGDHFVLLTKKDGDDFIMHDPVYGPDLKFSSHYSIICSAGTFR